MIYRPTTGSLWDASVFWHEGKYYAVMMYNPDGPVGLQATCGLIAHSDDGVHWQDGWTVTPEPSAPQGGKFLKAFVSRISGRFVMNHGVLQPHGWQDTLRYYESTDLREWTYLGCNTPDPRWYEPIGRWDHMYVIPKDEADPAAGYYGYPVATPKPGLPRGCGLCETMDGRSWTILPPPVFDWGEVPPKDLEIGGVERIEDRYVMIGGHADFTNGNGYLMYTLTADAPTGPFRPDPEAHRLCGNLTKAADPVGHQWTAAYLAAWGRCRNGEKLISNYAQALSGIWLLPLRKPILADGHLRLGWWEQNERLKGKELPLAASWGDLAARGARQAQLLDLAVDPQAGLIVEGRIEASPAGAAPAAGIAFPGRNGRWLELRLELGEPEGRCTRIGWWEPGSGFAAADTIGRGCALVAGIAAELPHRFRLLVRQGLFELYVNDLLVQTYSLNEHWEGTLGFLAVDATAEFSNLRAWEMSLG